MFASLETELNALPQDLEPLYQYLLDSIQKARQKSAYMLLDLGLQNNVEDSYIMPTMCLFLDHYEQDMYFAQHSDLRLQEWRWTECEPSESAMEDLRGKAEQLLQGYCRGLVEVCSFAVEYQYSYFLATHTHECHIRQSEQSSRCLRMTHRSGMEFLKKPEIANRISHYSPAFERTHALFQLTLADLRCIDFLRQCPVVAADRLLQYTLCYLPQILKTCLCKL